MYVHGLVTVSQIRESCVLGDGNALPAADCRNASVMIEESPEWFSSFVMFGRVYSVTQVCTVPC